VTRLLALLFFSLSAFRTNDSCCSCTFLGRPSGTFPSQALTFAFFVFSLALLSCLAVFHHPSDSGWYVWFSMSTFPPCAPGSPPWSAKCPDILLKTLELPELLVPFSPTRNPNLCPWAMFFFAPHRHRPFVSVRLIITAMLFCSDVPLPRTSLLFFFDTASNDIASAMGVSPFLAVWTDRFCQSRKKHLPFSEPYLGRLASWSTPYDSFQ